MAARQLNVRRDALPARGLPGAGARPASLRLAGLLAEQQGRLVLWLPMAMGVGTLGYFALLREPSGWCGPAIAAVGLAVALSLRRHPVARIAGLLLLMMGLGFASASFATWRAPPLLTLPRRATVVAGVVRGVEAGPGGRRLTLVSPSLDGGPTLPRALHLRLRGTDDTAVSTGQAVRVRALMRAPAPPAYPGAWDLQRDDFFSGLGGGGFALGKVSVLDPADAASDGLAGWWQSVRDGVAQRVLAALPADQAGIAATLLTGQTAAIPAGDRAAFRNAGLAHLIAIAGLHLGIVIGLVLGGTRFVLVRSERIALHWPVRQIAALAALATGGLYLLLTGAHLPILRSFAMACLVTAGLIAGRRALSLRGLALAAVVLLAISPNAINGVSFQMSFSAVLALIAGYEALRPALTRLRGDGRPLHRARHHVAALALTSLLAGSASAPFGAYHFGAVQPYFVLANLIAVPITAVFVMPLGLLSLALMPLHLEALALVPMGWGIAALLAIARTVAAWPEASLPVPHIPSFGLALVTLGLASLGLWRGRLRLCGIALLLAGLLSPLLAHPPDLLVSSDARLIAWRRPDGLLLQRGSGASAFTLDAWQHYWASSAAAPLPQTANPGIGGDGLACPPVACRIGHVLLVRDVAATDLDCAGVALVVAAEPAQGVCQGVPRVDRFTVWRDGAEAIWLTKAGARVVSDRATRGDRPWVPAPPTARGQPKSELPPALAE